MCVNISKHLVIFGNVLNTLARQNPNKFGFALDLFVFLHMPVESFNNKPIMNVEVNVGHIPVINFSMQQNHVPVVREITIKNIGDEDLGALNIDISFDPEFAATATLHADGVAAGQELRLTDIPIQISTSYLSSLTERISGHICLNISTGDTSIFSATYEIALLAFDQWSGIAILPEMLAAFVTPNHPDITPIIKRASEILGSWTGSPSLDEYQTRDPDRVKKQMAAVYEGVAERHIAYCTVPASFEDYGQRIRLYSEMLSDRLGTCLDMTLLYAGCLEAIGIRPLVIVIEGHAFAGAWLIPDSFPDSVNDDVSLLTKRTAAGINEILLVETTCMNDGKQISFDTAVEAANDKLRNPDNFILFVDIARARNARIRPLPLRVVRDGIVEIREEPEPERTTDAPAALSATDIILDGSPAKVGRQTIWERKLLDLSLRNSLLNTRITKNTLQLIPAKINELEDALADGDEFQILGKPTDWDNPLMSAGIYQKLHAKDPIIDLIKDELRQKRLRAYLSEDALHRAVTHLYRSSRLSMEENGANTLYLAIGLLRWLETPSSRQPRFAPILLLPIEIVRKSAAKGFVIRSRDEETMLNITLLEMLRQFFGITIGGLDPLPRDESGVDVTLIFNTIRRAIMQQTGWDVEEQAIIGNFSFSKFIMWNDIHNNADKLARNRIVSSLISGKMEWDPEEDETAANDLDDTYPEGDIALPIGADSSQFEAICAAVDGKSFILHGPPGTGKSQTITNIIANALYKGKKVLFVAEKMAALQVVQRRLEAIGLAPFCLELHSNKTKKANILEQLKRTTEVVKTKPSEAFRIKAEQLNALRKELNGYVRSLHKIYPAGISLYDCLAHYSEADCSAIPTEISQGTLKAATPESLPAFETAIADYQAIACICGDPARHPLSGIALTDCTPAIRSDAKRILKELLENLKELATLQPSLSDIFKIEVGALSSRQQQAFCEIVRILLNAAVIPPAMLMSPQLPEILPVVEKAALIGKERDIARDAILQNFDSTVLDADIKSWESVWRESTAKWFIPRFFGCNKVCSLIRPYTHAKTKPEPQTLEQLFTDYRTYSEKQRQLEIHGRTLAPLLGVLWDMDSANWHTIAESGSNVGALQKALIQLCEDTTQAHEIITALARRLEYGIDNFRAIHRSTLSRYAELKESAAKLCEDLNRILSADIDANAPASNNIEILSRWDANLQLLHDWSVYNIQRQKVAALGLEEIAVMVENGQTPPAEIEQFYRKSFFKSYAEFILAQEPAMNAFHGMLFDQKAERFKQLCSEFERLTREELFATLASSLPALQKEAAQSSEVGILQRNIRNGGRGTSIRRLFAQIQSLLTRMCPCMLMSPISVAQYIDPDGSPFDLVIFDEASQMPTSEAVGAIARGRNVIVVGDPKQMPPTNFFATTAFDEDNADKEDLESILDDCLALSIPSRYLSWHYRSKHESLIAFSNVKYYDNRLLTFPSPDDLSTKVGWQHVDGIYDRGKTRQNRAEAEAVIEEIRRRLSQPQSEHRSIGVVTFNTNQQSLIEDLLTDLFQANPDLEAKAMECEEPIFVKNLENVQGDERDIILFSIGYGPDKDGKIALNFGPLNRDGGWRRLNVAVSRARYEMKVFSTLRAEQIDLNRTSAEGVAGLKAFLEYAEKGRGSLYYEAEKRTDTSDALTQTIAAELTKRGYAVKTNIGCSGYKIDIGVVDNSCPDRYILGVLCDGNNNKSARTARDRVMTQTSVLHMLGWRLHHVWAMDWWENPARTIDTLVEAIDAAASGKAEPISAPIEEPATDEEPPIAAQPTPEADDYTRQYQVCGLEPEPISPDDLVSGMYDHNARNRISAVVASEAPISKRLLCKRVLNSFGIARMGTRLAVYMDRMLSESGLPVTGSDSPFYWHKDTNPEAYDVYRPVSDREAIDIAPEEISVALCHILDEQGSLPEEDLMREVANSFNYSRLGDKVIASISRAIDYSLVRRRIVRHEGRIHLAPTK